MSMNSLKLKFWKAFGDTRFTKNDLWREFGGNQFPGFATPEFLAGLQLDVHEWIEDAPGPRGGKGWKLTAKAVAQMQKQHIKKADQQASITDLISGVSVAFGSLRVVPSFQRNRKDKLVWSFLPSVEIEGRNVNGSLRYPSDAFSLILPIDSKPDLVQREINFAVRHVSELAVVQKSKFLKKIEILDSLVTPTANTNI